MVTLAPGGIAHAVLQVAEAGNYSSSACTPVTAHWLKIFPPNQVTAIYAHYEVQACSAKLPAKLGSQLDVYVVRPVRGRPGTRRRFAVTGGAGARPGTIASGPMNDLSPRLRAVCDLDAGRSP